MSTDHPSVEGQPVRVRLSDYPKGWGIKTEIEGRELPDVGDIEFTAPVDGVAKLTVQMIVNRPFEIEVSAKVVLNLLCLPGSHLLDVSTLSDPPGTRRLIVSFPEAVPTDSPFIKG